MAMLHAVDVGPLQWFFPMGTSSAVSLTHELPPGRPARGLLLGNGDLRNLLFTLYNDQNCKQALRDVV
jgi:Domain of unknown function (DUF4470)